MNFKLLALILLTIIFLYNLALNILHYRSSRNPIPENVKDIYDKETYSRWLAYHGEKSRMYREWQYGPRPAVPAFPQWRS